MFACKRLIIRKSGPMFVLYFDFMHVHRAMRKSIFPLLSWSSIDEKGFKTSVGTQRQIVCIETDFLLVRRVHAPANAHNAVFASIIGCDKTLNLVSEWQSSSLVEILMVS